MARQPEAVFRKRAMEQLKRLPNSWWVRIELPYIRGIPDALGCMGGRFIAIEFKRDIRQKPTKLQAFTMDLILKAGGLVFLASPENWPGIFNEISTFAYNEGGNYDQTQLPKH